MPVATLVVYFDATMNKDEEVIDVCQAIQTIADRAAKRAAEQQRMDTLLDNIKKLMEKMGWSAEQSMDVLSISENDRKLLAQQLK